MRNIPVDYNERRQLIAELPITEFTLGDVLWLRQQNSYGPYYQKLGEVVGDSGAGQLHVMPDHLARRGYYSWNY